MADYRFERTDEDIQRAFVQALERQGFDQLNVAQMARLSRVDRSTFYAHYDSLYALATAVIDREVALLNASISAGTSATSGAGDGYDVFSGAVVAHLLEQTAVIRQVRLIPLGTQSFDAQCRQLFAATYQRVLGVDPASFTGYLLVNMAMSDLDFILTHRRVPRREELQAGLAQIARIAARIGKDD